MVAKAKSAARRWVAKAEIDYMTHFVTAWITFNSCYSTKYSRIRGDRARIDRIANEPSGMVAKAIEKFLESRARLGVEFQNHLAGPYTELESVQLAHNGNHLSFELILSSGSAIQSSPNKFGSRSKRQAADNFYESYGIYFVRDPSHPVNRSHITAKALVLILYQLRNRLFHGELNPKEDLQGIYMHAYFILLAIDRELAK